MSINRQIDEGNDSGRNTPITGDSALDTLIVAVDAARAFNEDIQSAITDITNAVHVGTNDINGRRFDAIRAINAAQGDGLYRAA